MVFQKKNREPQVIDGVRSTSDVPVRLGSFGPDGSAPKVLAAETPAYDPAKALWRFRSRAVNHMILLWAEPDEYMPGGRLKRGKIVHARFKEGQYETTSAEYAKIMLANPNCGIGRDFWDADHEDELARTAQYNAFKKNVQADPELFARFRKDFGAGDFDDVLTAPEAVPAD
jgi:hypothetical protein